ncbi:MAG TPA: hypothetical protein VE913_15145 [Longimicrobium sp.]|nr:hypothetical protein [Longimicrobium sp.]
MSTASTDAIGEEDTTQALGEECGCTSDGFGEEGDPWPPIAENVSAFGGF